MDLFLPTQSLRILKLFSSVLMFHDHACICRDLVRIFSPCNRAPTPTRPLLFDLQSIKGDTLRHWKGLIASTKRTALWSLSHCCSQEMGTLNIAPCNLGTSSTGKDISAKTLFNSTGKTHSSYCQPMLCHQTSDSWIHVSHLKTAPNPGWTCTPTGDLNVKISRN